LLGLPVPEEAIMDNCDTNPMADKLIPPNINAVRKACRIMGAQLINFDRFMSHGLYWLSNKHGRIRIEYGDDQWMIEPIDDDGKWTEEHAGVGRTIHDAIANAVINSMP
jgi:hypothetical protein